MNKSILAVVRAMYAAHDLNPENILEHISHDVLTENVARNGRDVLWYMDDVKNIALYVDTLEELTEQEIDKELL